MRQCLQAFFSQLVLCCCFTCDLSHTAECIKHTLMILGVYLSSKASCCTQHHNAAACLLQMLLVWFSLTSMLPPLGFKVKNQTNNNELS